MNKKFSLILSAILIVVNIIAFGYLIYILSGMDYEPIDKNSTQEGKMEGYVLMKTNYGDIKIKLYLDESPITAGNFKKLVQEGFYDGIRFHRVMDGFMIQGGDPYSKDLDKKAIWGTGGSNTIQDEYIEGLSNLRGTLAMANRGPNTGSSQFFINLVDNTYLDWDKAPASSKHPVFGEVIEGMDVVDAIAKVQTEAGDRPVQDVLIEKATWIEG